MLNQARKGEKKLNIKSKSKSKSKSGSEILSLAELKTILKKSGLKLTKSRILILNLLVQKALPITVEDIMKNLKSESPDKTTIYRILKQAVSKGLVNEIHFKDGIVRYEAKILDQHDDCCHVEKSCHCHHIVCKSCGIVDHIDSHLLEDAIKKVSNKVKGFSVVDEHTLEFFGYCNSCSTLK